MSNATSTTRTRRSRRQPRVQQAVSDAAISREVDSWFRSQLRTLTPRNRGDEDSFVPEALSLVDDDFVHYLTNDDEFVEATDRNVSDATAHAYDPDAPENDPWYDPEPEEIPHSSERFRLWHSSYFGGDGGALPSGINTDQDFFLPPYNGPRIQRFTVVEQDAMPIVSASAWGRGNRFVLRDSQRCFHLVPVEPSAAERAGIEGPADADVVKAAQHAAYTENVATTKVA